MELRTLSMKLGLKEGMRAYALNRPLNYDRLIADSPVIPSESPMEKADFVHLFSDTQKHLMAQINIALPTLGDQSMLWISWPKKASGEKTDLSRPIILRIGRAIGMKDVKVCSIDATWSALKFV